MNYLIVRIFESFDPKEKNTCVRITRIFSQAIYEEDLPLGMEMPSKPELREYLRVSYSTVSRTYKNLKVKGLIETLVGRGTWITTVLPMSAEPKALPEPSGFVDDRRRPRLFNADDLLQPDVEMLCKEMTKQFYAADLNNASLRSAVYIREILERMGMKIKHVIGVNYAPDQLLMGNGYKSVLTHLCYTFLQLRELVVITTMSPLSAVNIFRFCARDICEIREDEEGIVTADLEQLCQRRKVGFVYLNSGPSHISKSQMSLARISHLIELSFAYEFIIVEDECYKDLHSPEANELVKLAHKAKARMFYLSKLTFVHPSLSKITMVAGNAGDIRKLQERLVAVAESVPVQLIFTIHKLIVSGKLFRAEIKIKNTLTVLQQNANRILIGSGLWIDDSVLNQDSFYYRLKPAMGKFPPNLFLTLEKNRLYLIDPAKVILGPIVDDVIILSLAAYLSGMHLDPDLHFFNEKMSGMLIY